MQVQSVATLADKDSLLCQGNSRSRRITHVSEKYTFPHRRSFPALHVVNVKHQLRKALIENSRLDFKRNLRALQLILQVNQSLLRTRCQVTLFPSASSQAARKKIERTRKNCQTPMPLAFIAVISLSA